MQFSNIIIIGLFLLAQKSSSAKNQIRLKYKKAHQIPGAPLDQAKQIPLSLNPFLDYKNISYVNPQIQTQDVGLFLPIDGRNDGSHSYNQMIRMFENKNMTSAQIKAIVSTIDADKSGMIDQSEWLSFYNIFYVPFKIFDKNNDFILNQNETFLCLTNVNKTHGYVFEYFLKLQPHQMNKLFYMMDSPFGVNFYIYLFLRRVNLGFDECAENNFIIPHRIYCALMITSPRTRKLYGPDEREMFLASQVLTDGYYLGQTSKINLVQFIALAYLYNYFDEYEIPFDDGYIKKEDMMKAVNQCYQGIRVSIT